MKKLAKMLIICREVDKNSGEVAIYPLKAEVTAELMAQLSQRARLNPDLRYFATLTETWEEPRYRDIIEQLLSLPEITPRMLEENGGLIVEV